MPDHCAVMIVCRHSIDRQGIARAIESEFRTSIRTAATLDIACQLRRSDPPTHILIDRDLANDPAWHRPDPTVSVLFLEPAIQREEFSRRISGRSAERLPANTSLLVKPEWSTRDSAAAFSTALVRWLESGAGVPGQRAAERREPQVRPRLLAIGASTGGPQALAKILPQLDLEQRPPILIVNHMAEGFTQSLAEDLGRLSPFEVREARDGDRLEPGVALLAPGGRHMQVVKRDCKRVVQLSDGPAVNSCRPSVDVLFESLVSTFGGETLAVILTGMGQDGAQGATALAAAGARILIQSEDSSTAYGMPRAAAAALDTRATIVPLGFMVREIRDSIERGLRCS